MYFCIAIMANIPILPALLVLTGAECALNIFIFPYILPGTPITKLFLLLMTINSSLWAFWKIFIYPYWFSPWRHYARPKASTFKHLNTILDPTHHTRADFLSFTRFPSSPKGPLAKDSANLSTRSPTMALFDFPASSIWTGCS